jgi:hypothetical protein
VIYYLSDKIKEDKMVGACSRNKREMRNAYNNLVENPGGKRSLGRPGHRWEDNVRMDLRVVGWEGVEWIRLA